MYRYYLPLLIINSEMKFGFEKKRYNQCKDLDKNATNVYIKKGNVDYLNYNATRKKHISDNFVVLLNDESMLLNLNKQGILIYIKDDTVVVDYKDLYEHIVLNNLVELIIPYYYHKKGGLVLHASSCRYNGKTILFTADSGVGKTTLLLSLLKLGAEYISDDIVCILENNNRYQCFGLDFTLPKANANTIKMLDINSSNIIGASGINAKSFISLKNNYPISSFVDAVIFLKPVNDNNGIKLRKESEPEKQLLEQTIGIWGISKIEIIKLLSKWKSFADAVNVYSMEYTKESSFLDEVVSYLQF